MYKKNLNSDCMYHKLGKTIEKFQMQIDYLGEKLKSWISTFQKRNVSSGRCFSIKGVIREGAKSESRLRWPIFMEQRLLVDSFDTKLNMKQSLRPWLLKNEIGLL